MSPIKGQKIFTDGVANLQTVDPAFRTWHWPQVRLLSEGDEVGDDDGTDVGKVVGRNEMVGAVVGLGVGLADGEGVGFGDGFAEDAGI